VIGYRRGMKASVNDIEISNLARRPIQKPVEKLFETSLRVTRNLRSACPERVLYPSW